MGRYSPQVLPQYANPFASFLQGGATGVSQALELRGQVEAIRAAREARQQAQWLAGAVPMKEWEQTSRPAQAGKAFSEELGTRLPGSFDPTGFAQAALSGTGAAVRRIGEQASPLAARQAVAKGTLARELSSPAMAAATARGDAPAMLQETVRAATHATDAMKPPTGAQLRDYLTYADRPAGMEPHRVGSTMVDPMLAYDRTRAASRLQDAELARELGDVQLESPVAQALLHAGHVQEALTAENQYTITSRWREREAGVAGRAATAAELRGRALSMQERIERMRLAAGADNRAVETFRILAQRTTALQDQLSGVRGDNPRANALRGRLSEQISGLNWQMRQMEDDVGIPTIRPGQD